MSRDVTNYDGIKYSLQPHGLRSKLVYAFLVFVLAFGGALAVASPAQAAPPGSIFVSSSCYPNMWYVNHDESSRIPEQLSGGFRFQPADLAHLAFEPFPLSEIGLGGTFVAEPAPDENFRTSVEIISAGDGTGYATLHWNGSAWFVGGSGTEATNHAPSVDPMVFIGLDHKYGEIKEDSVVISFTVGYTNSPPGDITTVVSSVTFAGNQYDLTCGPVRSSASPVAVPGPTYTVTRTVTVTPSLSATPSVSPTPSPSVSPSPTASQTPRATQTSSPAVNAEDEGGNPLLPWGIAAVGVTGVALVTIGAVGMARRRRYQGAHAADNSQTQTMPAVEDDDGYNLNDYRNGFEPELGGWSGDTYDETVELPPVDEDPGETKQFPPANPTDL